MTDALETEVKFAVADLAAVRERLLAAGAELIQPLTREFNLRFDDPWGGLGRAGKVLRLRQDSQARLTLKLPVGPWGTEAKTLREIEVTVSDFQAARQILTGLGYRAWVSYEKMRQTYRLAGAAVSLDELPFGCYVEIEGSLAEIESAAARLGLETAERITAGYVALFLRARQRLNLPFDDCTFANWESLAGATHL